MKVTLINNREEEKKLLGVKNIVARGLEDYIL